MTLADLKLLDKDLLGESTYDRFDEDEHERWLNRALEDIAGKTEYVKSEATWTTTATEEEIPYPADAFSIIRIEYNNEELPETSRDRLDEEDADWEGADSGAPQKWYPDRNMTYALYPKPDDEYTLTVYYLSVDDALTSDSQSPNIPKVWHKALSFYAAGWMKISDGEVMAGNKYLKEYERLVFGEAKKIAIKEKFSTSGVRIALAKWSYRDEED